MSRISTLVLTIVVSGALVLLGGGFILWVLALPSKGKALALTRVWRIRRCLLIEAPPTLRLKEADPRT
jgi:uncharacterized membrane protein